MYTRGRRWRQQFQPVIERRRGREEGRSSFRLHELSSCNISTRGLREVFFFFFFLEGKNWIEIEEGLKDFSYERNRFSDLF